MSHGLEAAADVLGMAGLMGLASLYFWLIGRLGSGSRNKIGLGGAPNEATLQKVRAFLDGLAAKLGEGQSYVDTNSKNVEWRGQVHDHPVRIQVYWQYTIQLYVKGPAGLGDLPTLRWDEKLVPQVGAPPPWDTTDTELVFLAKGVYVEGSSAETTRDLARFRRLPQEVGQALVTDMREVGIERVYFDDDGFVEADFKTDLYELPDPGPKNRSHGPDPGPRRRRRPGGPAAGGGRRDRALGPSLTGREDHLPLLRQRLPAHAGDPGTSGLRLPQLRRAAPGSRLTPGS